MRNVVGLWAAQNTRPETLAHAEKLKDKVAAVTSFLELVAKLTFQIAMRDGGTSQQHESFVGGAARLLAHLQLPELMQP